MRLISKLKYLIFAIGVGLFSMNCTAGEDTGNRKIVDLGCHNNAGICYVTLDGPAFGGTLGCAGGVSNEFRFDNGDTPLGRSTYAGLLAAYLSGKNVRIYLDGCTGQGLPKIAWYHISD